MARMKKLLIAPFLILMLALVGFGQVKNIATLKKERKTFKNNKYYAVGYDKFKDISIVSFNGSVIGGKKSFLFGGALVGFGVDFYFKGQELKESSQQFILQFVGYSNGIKNALSDSALYVLADEKRFEYKEGIKDSNLSQDILGNLQTTESLKFLIDREDIQTFADSKTLEIKIGGKAYKVDAEHRQIFKDVLAISKIN